MFSRNEKLGIWAFLAVWFGVLLANLVVWGVLIWAVIELVQWATSK